MIFFAIKNGVCTAVYRYGKDGKLLSLEIEEYIIKRLKEDRIPLNNVIVKGAFREFFNYNLEEYILQLQSYDNLYNGFKKKIKK